MQLVPLPGSLCPKVHSQPQRRSRQGRSRAPTRRGENAAYRRCPEAHRRGSENLQQLRGVTRPKRQNTRDRRTTGASLLHLYHLKAARHCRRRTSAVSRSLWMFLEAMITSAPCSKNCFAISLHMPEPPPVMKATLEARQSRLNDDWLGSMAPAFTFVRCGASRLAADQFPLVSLENTKPRYLGGLMCQTHFEDFPRFTLLARSQRCAVTDTG